GYLESQVDPSARPRDVHLCGTLHRGSLWAAGVADLGPLAQHRPVRNFDPDCAGRRDHRRHAVGSPDRDRHRGRMVPAESGHKAALARAKGLGRMTAILDIQGLSKRFGGFVALDGIDLAVAAGERVGLIGPNGSGKSTLVNCICGTLTNETGTV